MNRGFATAHREPVVCYYCPLTRLPDSHRSSGYAAPQPGRSCRLAGSQRHCASRRCSECKNQNYYAAHVMVPSPSFLTADKITPCPEVCRLQEPKPAWHLLDKCIFSLKHDE